MSAVLFPVYSNFGVRLFLNPRRPEGMIIRQPDLPPTTETPSTPEPTPTPTSTPEPTPTPTSTPEPTPTPTSTPTEIPPTPGPGY